MGLTFKENCPDIRNSRVVDILEELAGYNIVADVFDPWVDAAEARREYGVTPVAQPPRGGYDATILAVAHEQFRRMGPDEIRAFGKPEHVLYDLKYVLPRHAADLRL
jgi:UDP-N-acetyl-D-galactosamine dehydrogenase